MKKILLLSFLLLSIYSCKQQKAEIKSPPSKAVTTLAQSNGPSSEMVMTIEGMMCAIGCAATIEKKLNATAGITLASVDFDTKKARLTFDTEILTPTAIKAIVTDLSDVYSITEFSVTD